jgi:putative transposase
MAVSKRRQFSAEKGICHMSEDTIAKLPDPSGNSPDPLTDVIRSGARRLIEQAIEAELATLLSAFADHKLEDGRARLVRHGHLQERDILTGIGPVAVKVPRVRIARRARTRSRSRPASCRDTCARRSRSRSCCRGSTSRACPRAISAVRPRTRSVRESGPNLAALLGPAAKGLSAKTITRLKADWWTAYQAWEKRGLGTRRLLYIWADGVYFKPRMADEVRRIRI